MDDALFEIDNMCHALGFDPSKIRKGQRTYEYYRNFFVASGEYKESWEKLVKWGNAAKTKCYRRKLLLCNSTRNRFLKQYL